jgi:hypothetical protein
LAKLQSLNETLLTDVEAMEKLEQQVDKACEMLEFGITGHGPLDGPLVKLQLQSLIKNMKQDLLNLPYLM